MADKTSRCGRFRLDRNLAHDLTVAQGEPNRASGRQQRPEPGQDTARLSSQAERLRAWMESGDCGVNAKRLARQPVRLEQELA